MEPHKRSAQTFLYRKSSFLAFKYNQPHQSCFYLSAFGYDVSV